MRNVEFEEGFRGWREQARALLADAIPPEEVRWCPTRQPLLPSLAPEAETKVPRRFLSIAKRASWHRAPQKWELLYRVLWRLTHENPNLLESTKDRDARELAELDGDVRSELRRMRLRVHFRILSDDDGDRLVAYYAPNHPVLEAWLPEIGERHALMPWSIWTPEESCHWDLLHLTKAPGAAFSRGETLEAFWERVRALVPRERAPALQLASQPTTVDLIAPPESLRGAPGRVLARALKLAGLSGETFHATNFSEISRAVKKPEALLVLGKENASEVLGMPVVLEDRHGRVFPTLWCDQTSIAQDPAQLLKTAEEPIREAEFQRLVSDLKKFNHALRR